MTRRQREEYPALDKDLNYELLTDQDQQALPWAPSRAAARALAALSLGLFIRRGCEISQLIRSAFNPLSSALEEMLRSLTLG